MGRNDGFHFLMAETSLSNKASFDAEAVLGEIQDEGKEIAHFDWLERHELVQFLFYLPDCAAEQVGILGALLEEVQDLDYANCELLQVTQFDWIGSAVGAIFGCEVGGLVGEGVVAGGRVALDLVETLLNAVCEYLDEGVDVLGLEERSHYEYFIDFIRGAIKNIAHM